MNNEVIKITKVTEVTEVNEITKVNEINEAAEANEVADFLNNKKDFTLFNPFVDLDDKRIAAKLLELKAKSTIKFKRSEKPLKHNDKIVIPKFNKKIDPIIEKIANLCLYSGSSLANCYLKNPSWEYGDLDFYIIDSANVKPLLNLLYDNYNHFTKFRLSEGASVLTLVFKINKEKECKIQIINMTCLNNLSIANKIAMILYSFDTPYTKIGYYNNIAYCTDDFIISVNTNICFVKKGMEHSRNDNMKKRGYRVYEINDSYNGATGNNIYNKYVGVAEKPMSSALFKISLIKLSFASGKYIYQRMLRFNNLIYCEGCAKFGAYCKGFEKQCKNCICKTYSCEIKPIAAIADKTINVCIDLFAFNKFCFADKQKAEEFVMKTMTNRIPMYEVVDNTAGDIYPYFDIDHDNRDSFDIEAKLNEIRKKFDDYKGKFYVYKSSNIFKDSYHIYMPDVVLDVEDRYKLKRINGVDRSVYNTNSKFRLPLSMKITTGPDINPIEGDKFMPIFDSPKMFFIKVLGTKVKNEPQPVPKFPIIEEKKEFDQSCKNKKNELQEKLENLIKQLKIEKK